MTYIFTDAEIAALPDVLSQPRFRTYLLATSNTPRKALALYQWNAEVSAAYLYAIHIFEICVRNAVANVAETVYGQNWTYDRNFELSLPNPQSNIFSPRRELISTRNRPANISNGKIIADMKFAFWESMYTSRHDNRLWNLYLAREFPALPPDLSTSAARTRIRNVAEAVRKLRNRIAHHEPIFTRDLRTDYEGIVEIVGFRSVQTAHWLSRTQTIFTCLDRKP